MINYTQEENRIILSFAYDLKVIRIVRAIPGAHWDGKHWSIPCSQFARLSKALGYRMALPVQTGLPLRTKASCHHCGRDTTNGTNFCDDDHYMRYLSLTNPRLHNKIFMERLAAERKQKHRAKT